MTLGDILLIVFGASFLAVLGLLSYRLPSGRGKHADLGFDVPTIDTDVDVPSTNWAFPDSTSSPNSDSSAGNCGFDSGSSGTGSIDTGSCSPN